MVTGDELGVLRHGVDAWGALLTLSGHLDAPTALLGPLRAYRGVLGATGGFGELEGGD